MLQETCCGYSHPHSGPLCNLSYFSVCLCHHRQRRGIGRVTFVPLCQNALLLRLVGNLLCFVDDWRASFGSDFTKNMYYYSVIFFNISVIDSCNRRSHCSFFCKGTMCINEKQMKLTEHDRVFSTSLSTVCSSCSVWCCWCPPVVV